MPRSETHVRPLLSLPKEERVERWLEIVAETPPAKITGRQVTKLAKQHIEALVVDEKPARESVNSPKSHAQAALRRLELSIQNLSHSVKIKQLLRQVEQMISESK